MTTIKGTLNRITFKNEDNHYTIARLKVHEIKEPITIVGHLAGVAEGEMLLLTGKWTSHAKYGEQFKVERFEVALPVTLSGIKKYLSSGLIKGIGLSTAKKIVEFFKEESLDIIENAPHRLCEVPGIGKSTMSNISNAWDKHHAVRKVMQFLQEHGVGIAHASAIINFYGKDALSILNAKPYQISKDIPEAGFEVADAIALKTGINPNDPERIKASIIYILIQNESSGHVFSHIDDVFSKCIKLTGTNIETIETALINLSDRGEIKIKNNLTNIYTKKMYKAETGIASKIKAMLSIPVSDYDVDDKIIELEVLNKLGLKLSEEQSDIVKQIFAHRVSVITGGPGTGKTTLIRAVCAVFSRLDKTVLLSSPTGRAARRLSEVTRKRAATLHKMLFYDADKEIFGRNQDNPLDCDVVIVDEMSMVDTILMYHFMLAVPLNAVLIFVGDVFQLPSVGPGNILSDIIKSEVVKTFFLTKIFRQAERSPIILNAHSIRNGQMPVLEKKSKNDELSEFYFIENNNPEYVVRIITELCTSRIKNAFKHIDEIQVITPMHKGEAGTINLNQKLQQTLNPQKSSIQAINRQMTNKNISLSETNSENNIESAGFLFRRGDKVMHLKNNYQKDVFNGDIGFVDEVIKSENKIIVDYDGRLVEYDILELDELTLAYAISVHKSQGSEYQAVVIALTTMHYPLLQRNLLYTAVTRGKKLVIIVGSKRALEIALNNNRTDMRLSGLCEKIQKIS